jgi:hypothetical protein
MAGTIRFYRPPFSLIVLSFRFVSTLNHSQVTGVFSMISYGGLWSSVATGNYAVYFYFIFFRKIDLLTRSHPESSEQAAF